MSDLHPVISMSLLVGMVFAVTWIAAETARRLTVRGSHPRYVWASAERAARWPAGIWLIMSTAVEFSYGTPLMGLMNGVGAALWLLLLAEKHRDGNDDDYWSDLKKKIQTWGRQVATDSI